MKVVIVGNITHVPPDVAGLIDEAICKLREATSEMNKFLDLLPPDGKNVAAAREFAIKARDFRLRIIPEARGLQGEARLQMTRLKDDFCVEQDMSCD